MPGSFDGNGKGTLMPGTDAGLPLGLYLIPVGDIAPESTYLFVIYDRHLLDAESAYLAPGHITAPSTRPAATRLKSSPLWSCWHSVLSPPC